MADIDKDKPGDSDLISQYPQNERDSRSAIETILSVDHEAGSDTADDGKHTIVQLLAQSSITGVAGQGALYTKDVGSGVIELFHKDESGNETQLTDRGKIPQSSIDGGLVSGTNMVFHQASAPTGWTQDTSVNDRVLRVVDNTGTGGATGGSWTISGVTVDGHVLTNAEMPSHNHGGSTNNSTADVVGSGLDPQPGNTNTGQYEDLVDIAVTNTGSTFDFGSWTTSLRSASGNIYADNHSHGISTEGSDNAHSHGLTADGNWRPAHADVIAATKD